MAPARKRKHADNKDEAETRMMMKLVFPAGDRPQLLLDQGVYRIGSGTDVDEVMAHIAGGRAAAADPEGSRARSRC